MIPTIKWVIELADFKYDILVVSLRRVAPNTSEQRSRSGLCEGVIRREATETEGLVIIKTLCFFVTMIMLQFDVYATIDIVIFKPLVR